MAVRGQCVGDNAVSGRRTRSAVAFGHTKHSSNEPTNVWKWISVIARIFIAIIYAARENSTTVSWRVKVGTRGC